MNKNQFIDTLAARFEGNRKAAAHALDAVIDTITREVVKGEKVDFKAEKAEGGIEQILLDPIVITRENMDLLVKDNFYTKDQLVLK